MAGKSAGAPRQITTTSEQMSGIRCMSSMNLCLMVCTYTSCDHIGKGNAEIPNIRSHKTTHTPQVLTFGEEFKQ